MFKVKNTVSGKFAKDAITSKALVFSDMESAKKCAESLQCFAVASEKRANFIVVKA